MKKLTFIAMIAVLAVLLNSCKKDDVKTPSNHLSLKLATSGDTTSFSGGQNPPVIK